MTTYEECSVCFAREAFNDGPCDKCRHKSTSASIETRQINGVQYYALKQASTTKKEVKPYWLTLFESY